MEQKFIAWDKEKKAFIYLPETGDVELIQDSDFIEFDYCKDQIEIFQSTGKKDINGKTIYYDSSIVEFEFTDNFGVITLTGIIEFCESQMKVFVDVPLHGASLEFDNSTMSNFKIIGTIQENPELLEIH